MASFAAAHPSIECRTIRTPIVDQPSIGLKNLNVFVVLLVQQIIL
jgi:hypothetical protein